MSSSCILYQNPSATITIIDIPRSIELSQGQSTRRLLSTEPLKEPFPSLEPKSAKARAKLDRHSLNDLFIQKHLEFSLAEIGESYKGHWCSPRETEGQEMSLPTGKRRKLDDTQDPASLTYTSFEYSLPYHLFATPFFQNPQDTPMPIRYTSDIHALIPAKSTVLRGDLLVTKATFLQNAPKFNLIIMDPPWPNRSARRKGGYDILTSTSDIRSLLTALPLEDYVAEDGYLGVWITNKTIFRDLALEMFDEWGVELVEEWIWLKVTSKGEPICALDGLWRKPYEILLVARKGGLKEEEGVKKRVVIGVPDLHSRKPSLKFLFEDIMQKKTGEYQALEIFARNLTEGWWGWGNEALKFQEEEYWIDSTVEDTPLDSS